MPEIAVNTAHNELAGTTGGAPAGNHAAWLKQFESAQWQQRLRYQPTAEQDRHADPSRAQRDAEKPLPKAPAEATGDDRGAMARNVQETVAGSAAGEGAASVATAAAGSGGTPMRLAPVAVAPLQERPAALAMDQRHLTAPLPRRPASIPWQAQHAHAMLDAEGVKLWLRDARYAGSDGQQLLQALRGHFMRLGLRLTQFTLNGTTILKTDHISNSTQHD